MSNWPLPFKLRLAGAAAVLVTVVVVLVVTGGGGDPEQAPVPVTTEEWQAGREAGGWVPVEVPAEAAAFAAAPAELAGGRIAAFDLPAGTIVTAEMLHPPGTDLADDTAATVWVAADIGRWHGGPAAGERAVFAAMPAGCAALELELVDVEAGQVAVEADPSLFAALVEGEPWTVWASPAAGWEDQCPADAGPRAEPEDAAEDAGAQDAEPGSGAAEDGAGAQGGEPGGAAAEDAGAQDGASGSAGAG